MSLKRVLRIMNTGVVVCLALPWTIGVAVASTTTPQVIVSAFSEKGDGIANGVSAVYSARWSTVNASTSGVYLFNSSPSGPATFSFNPVAGQSLAVGDYENLQPAQSRSAGFAGIDITGPGRPSGCLRLSGSFHVWDIASDASGTLIRLDLTYVEHCGAGRASNFGEVFINDSPHLGALVTSAARITFPDQTPTLPYVVTNPTSQSQPVAMWQSATVVSHFTLSPLRPSCATNIPPHSSCTYDLRLVPPRPGVYLGTVLAVSGASLTRLSLSGTAGGA